MAIGILRMVPTSCALPLLPLVLLRPRASQGVERTCIKLLVCVILVVDFILLWPILFSLKVDGTISTSWVAIWTPLWIWDALGP